MVGDSRIPPVLTKDISWVVLGAKMMEANDTGGNGLSYTVEGEGNMSLVRVNCGIVALVMTDSLSPK
jgi:hypothetical protein